MPRPRGSHQAPPLEITITWNLRRNWHAQPLLQRVATHIARAEGFTAGSLSIAVVGARAMSTLHERFMNIAGPTDVMTFDLDTDRAAGMLEAEIVVCADVAQRAARRRRNKTGAQCGPSMAAARAELALYVTHGILHLAGYDDHDPADFARMHAREDELLTALGLGRVFSGG